MDQLTLDQDHVEPDQAVRLAVLTSHPIQYQAPLWRALAKRLDLTVFFCSPHGLAPTYDSGFGQTIAFDLPLLEGYRYEFLPNLWRGPLSGNLFSLTNPSALWRLQRFDALLIRGYNHLTHWFAIAAGRLSGSATYMHVDSASFLKSALWKRLLKAGVLGPTLRALDGCLAVGSQNRAFYEAYGVLPERISLVPYAVDNDFFVAAATRLSTQREELRVSLDISKHQVVALFVGKLIRRKHPELLLRAIADLKELRQPEVVALIVGSGEEETSLRQLVRELNIENRVTFAGFRNQGELPRFYCAADLFVLPAEAEPWGLVVNEAMNFSLPLLLGPSVGAADDLLREGTNGFSLRGLGVQELSSRLQTLAVNRALREGMGAASKAIIAQWGIEQAADAITSSVRRTIAARS